MSQEKQLFPSSKFQALAMAYVQAQDLSSKTPEDVARMYDDAHARIYAAFKELHEEEAAKRRESRGY